MANEVINLDTVFSGFNSGTDLQPKNTRTNNQGVKINDIAGFVKIVDSDPSSGAGVKGDMVFAETSLYVCTETGGIGGDLGICRIIISKTLTLGQKSKQFNLI